MGGLTIPNLAPKSDPWAMFFQAFVQGQQIRQQREEFTSQQESRKMQREYQTALIKAQDRADKIAEREYGFKVADLFKGISGTRSPAPLQTPTGAPMEGPMGLPSLTHTLDLPGLGPTQTPSLEGVFQQLIAKQRIEAQGAQMQNAVPLPAGVAENIGLPAGLESADARLLPNLPAQVNLPPGLLPTLPQGGRIPKDVVGVGQSVFQENAQTARSKADRASSERVASTNLQATRENQRLTREGKLLDDYRTETKSFGVIDDQIGRMREFAKLQTGAADIGMLYSYMKMLDPESAVREGEYATAQNTGGVPDRVRVMYNKALEGDRLAPQQRAEFLAAAETNYKVLQGRRSGVEKKFRQTANRWGIDPNILSQGGGGCPPGAPTASGPNGPICLSGGAWVPAQ